MANSEPGPGTSAQVKPTPLLARAAVFALMAVLLAFIGLKSRVLWQEWKALDGEQEVARSNVAVGYVNISPNPSYARRPDDWFHEDDGTTVLWSGWRDGVGHSWFRVGLGEVDRRDISLPMGRDVVQAIDYPVVEVGDGRIWRRIPERAKVIGEEIAGVTSAYPLRVLNKVEIINDTVADRAFLIYCNPLLPEEQSVSIYAPIVDGRRVTLGHAGYVYRGRPLLYDRGTESLWVAEKDAVVAVAGPLKGARLTRLARPRPVAWSQWRAEHPHGRLVVGADRSKGVPTL